MSKETEINFSKYPEIEFYKNEVGEARLGDAVTIVSHPFAQEITNDNLLRYSIEQGLPISGVHEALKVIDSTGFTSRFFHTIPDDNFDFDKDTDRTTEIGAYLLKRALSKQTKWGKEIDVLAVTSAFLPAGIGNEILQKAGLNPSKVKIIDYRTACAGGINALTDILANQNLSDARVAIASLEPLSLMVRKTHFVSPDRIAIPSIFGDDFAVTLIDPQKFKLTGLKTTVTPDHGVIKLKSDYNFFKTPNEPERLPAYYDLKKGAGDLIHYSESGVFIDLVSPADGKTTFMDGVGTGMHFGDHTAKQIEDLLKETGQTNLLRDLGHENMVMHSASRPVVNRIAKLLNRAGLIDTRSLPFYMDAWHRSNSSSATTMIRFQNMINSGLINLNKPVLLVAPGIGSMVVTATAWIKP